MAEILLVDDNSEVRSVLSRLLIHFGHLVTPADSGKAGLQLTQVRHFELIITDIVMPEGDGLETIPAWRRQLPQVKILAISGGGYQSATDYLKMGRQLGADLTLAKPFSAEQLKAALDTLLQ